MDRIDGVNDALKRKSVLHFMFSGNKTIHGILMMIFQQNRIDDF